MKLTLNQLDWTPMFESGRTPAHVTLTMPGGPSDHWESLCPTPDEWRVFVRKLKLYYLRAWGEPLLGVWKLEFQKRGAPHLHLLMAPPQGVAKSKHAYEFKYWLSYVWADIVNDPDPVEKRKHINAGTSVKLVELEHRGPDSIGDYFAKHGIFDAKEYQNEMPRIWRDAIAGDAPGIQFWGVWGLGKALAAVELNAARDDRGAATLDCITDPFGVERVIRFIIGEELTAAETAPGVTDKTIGRAVQRRLDHLGSQSSDYDKVQRHLRKLAKARHHRQFADMRVKNEHGQWILPGVIRDEFGTPLVNSAGIAVRAPGAPRPIKTPRVDAATGEVRVTTKYRIGTYNGTSGGLCGLDGIQAAHDVHRLIDRRANYDLRA